MLYVKYLLLVAGFSMLAWAVGALLYDLYLLLQFRKLKMLPEGAPSGAATPAIRWKTAATLGALAAAPLLMAQGITMVPSGMAGVLVSETQGTQAGTLYPGAHYIAPLVDHVELFDTRDQLFTTGLSEDGLVKGGGKAVPLQVQAKEGLNLGLAITVRYRLDSKRLDYIQANLPQPVEKEIVPPVAATVWREVIPTYTVRDVFSAKREEVRKRAADEITRRLAVDGIVVKEVMLRDVQCPPSTPKASKPCCSKSRKTIAWEWRRNSIRNK